MADDARDRKQVDDYIARNHDALNASIKKSRREIAAGNASSKSIAKIIAQGHRRHMRET